MDPSFVLDSEFLVMTAALGILSIFAGIAIGLWRTAPARFSNQRKR